VMVRVWHEAFLKPAPAGPECAPPAPSALQPWTQPLLVLATAGLLLLTVAAAVYAGPLYEVAQQAAGQLLDPAAYMAAVLGQ